jgi:hypothetical protein
MELEDADGFLSGFQTYQCPEGMNRFLYVNVGDSIESNEGGCLGQAASHRYRFGIGNTMNLDNDNRKVTPLRSRTVLWAPCPTN